MTRAQYLGYGIGAAGSAGFGTVPGLILAVYLTDTLGVAAAVAAIVVLVPKVWDMLFLPIVGNWSDSAVTRRGGRTRFIAIGAFAMLLAFPLMFAVPAGTHSSVAALWVLVAFTLAATAYAFFQVPYVALPAEITDVASERTTLLSWRVGLQLLGILTFGVGAPVMIDLAGAGNLAYFVMGAAVAVTIFIAMMACWFSVRRLPRFVSEETAIGGSLRTQFRVAWQARPFRVLVTVFVLQAIGGGAVLAATPYFSVNVLGITDFGLLFGLLLVPGALSTPLWSLVGHRLGTRRGFLIASSLFIVALLTSLAAPVLSLPVATALVALVAAGYAGMQMFPLAMLPDTIAENAAHTGTQRAGALTGVWTAGETLAFAVGPALVLLLLAVTGYTSTVGTEQMTQSASAVTGVRIAFSVLPALLVALSIPLMLRYPLREHTSS